MERTDQKKAEMEHLKSAFKLHPELFQKKWYVEDSTFLKQFGIHIPGKENCPPGYLKLYPSDFIVEEITSSGGVLTIDAPTPMELAPEKDASNDSHRALFATLVKCNITTNEAVDEMARKLGCDIKNIRYAGLKDKNAITAQAISFHNIDFSKVQSLNCSNYFLKDFHFGKGSVEKGGLRGNRFTLFIRTPEPADQAAFKKQEGIVAQNGFYNFYYLQRFGAPRFMNFQWGFDILRGRHREVVISFLTSTQSRELDFFQDLRKKIASLVPDWNKIYEIIEPFPLIFFIEHKMVTHLRNSPEDYSGALKTVPEQVMLWVYGFSSLLFNNMLSAYIQTNTTPPDRLPLFLSDKREDIDFYSQILKQVNLYPPDFRNLRPFSHLILKQRYVPTVEKIVLEKVAFTGEGVALRFSLNKGQYATTFLSHLFNLISGNVPDNIPVNKIDTPALLSAESISSTLTVFAEVNMAKKDFSLEETENN